MTAAAKRNRESPSMQSLRSVLIVTAIVAGIGCVTSLARPSRQIQLVELPGWEEPIPRNGKPVHAVVEVKERGAISLNDRIVDLESLPGNIRALTMRYPMALFRAESGVSYAISVKVLRAIAKAGVPRSKICFDDLALHRHFENSPYPANRKAPEPFNKGGLIDLVEMPAGNCASLLMPPPIY